MRGLLCLVAQILIVAVIMGLIEGWLLYPIIGWWGLVACSIVGGVNGWYGAQYWLD